MLYKKSMKETGFKKLYKKLFQAKETACLRKLRKEGALQEAEKGRSFASERVLRVRAGDKAKEIDKDWIMPALQATLQMFNSNLRAL